MVKLTTTICQYIISEFKPSLSYTRHTVSTNKIKLEASFHREKARQNRYMMSTLLAVGVWISITYSPFILSRYSFNSNHVGLAVRISSSLALTLLWMLAQVKFTFLVALCMHHNYDLHSFLLFSSL